MKDLALTLTTIVSLAACSLMYANHKPEIVTPTPTMDIAGYRELVINELVNTCGCEITVRQDFDIFAYMDGNPVELCFVEEK